MDVVHCGEMEIGEVLTYKGRTYVVVGLEPMSLPDRRCELEDAETDERISVPYAFLTRRDEGLSERA